MREGKRRMEDSITRRIFVLFGETKGFWILVAKMMKYKFI